MSAFIQSALRAVVSAHVSDKLGYSVHGRHLWCVLDITLVKISLVVLRYCRTDLC